MADWTAFGAVAGLVLFLVLALARVTTAALTSDGDVDRSSETRPESDAAAPDRSTPEAGATEQRPIENGGTTTAARDDVAAERVGEGSSPSPADAESSSRSPADAGPSRRSSADAEPSSRSPADAEPGLPSVSALGLLANVIVTHGALAAVIAGAAAMTEVPSSALGIADAPLSTGVPAVLGGVALGVALALANGVAAANLDRFGIDHSDALRTSLAPDGVVGWVLLLGVTLPLVALFEELLFRAVLVGAASAATGVSPWPFVVISSVAFAAGHGLQGRGGVLVTGLLGGVLAVAFVLTNSLLLVVVAHYVVNAAEFLLHEWLDVDVHGRLGA